MDRLRAGQFFPTSNGNVDVKRIDFHGPRTTPASLGGNDHTARATEGVQNNLASPRTVLDGVNDKRHRLDSRMHCKVLEPARMKRVLAAIGPNVRAISPFAAKLDGVDVSGRPHLENEDKLVLRPVEGTHASVVLRPNT